MPNKTIQLHNLDSLPKSSLHDRIYEIVNSCYAPESSPNGDIHEAMTQDILKILSQQQQEDYQEIVEVIISVDKGDRIVIRDEILKAIARKRGKV